jgi:hypothetical protein
MLIIKYPVLILIIQHINYPVLREQVYIEDENS